MRSAPKEERGVLTVRFVRALTVFGSAMLLVATMTCMQPASAGSPPRKPQPGVNDPRSGAALNRLQALDPRPQPLPVYPPDPRNTIHTGTVNNPAADTTAQDTQSETSVAVLPGKRVVAFNDSGSYNGSNNHFTGYAASTDSGSTFVDKGTLPASTEGDAGDPVLAAHNASGSLYMATLGFSTGENVQVFKSADGGQTFGAPVNGSPGFAGTRDFQDKEWITADNAAGTGNGNVYLCWTRFLAGDVGAEVRFTRSTNGGGSFGPSAGLLLSSGGQGCFVVTGPNHAVYVFYYRGTANGSFGQGGDNKLFVRKSNDAGVSFTPEVQVADLLSTTVNGDLGLSPFRSNSFPHAAVNPVTGAIYATFNDNPADADNADVYYTKSTDSGATWSSPVQVNNDDGGTDQFFPTVSVNPAGTRIMFGYYSRSFDASNSLIHRRGRLATVNTSTNAVGFLPSFQMGPNYPAVVNQDPVINPTYMGDYDQIAADSAGMFNSSWSDNKDGNTFHANQPDARYARINPDTATVGLSVSLSDSPDPVGVGHTVSYTATIHNSGPNAAEDVYLNDVLPAGFTAQSASGGTCDVRGRFASCLQGTINSGQSKIVTIQARALSLGSKSNTVAITTSDNDTTGANSATTSTTVNGSIGTDTYSTGNISTPIPDLTTVDIPISVPADSVSNKNIVADTRVRVRLDHTFDSDLSLSLISPTGVVVKLSERRGGSLANYGSGSNSCSGTFTEFRNDASTPIGAGVPPFAGAFRPEEGLDKFTGIPRNGTWKLHISDQAGGDVGTVGCVNLDIDHPTSK